MDHHMIASRQAHSVGASSSVVTGSQFTIASETFTVVVHIIQHQLPTPVYIAVAWLWTCLIILT